jgi:acetyl esterase/lipase
MDTAARLSRRSLLTGFGAAASLSPSFAADRVSPADPQVSDLKRLVDPELRPYLDGWSPPDLDTAKLGALRRQLTKSVSWRDAPVAAAQTIPGLLGGPPVSAILIYPPHGKGYRPAFVHMHGGGFLMGDAAMSVRRMQDIVARHQCFALLVDYRLAPEAPFPAAIDDGYAALQWLHDHAPDLGIDPARIGVVGESAGGGLAAMLALAARDRRGPSVAFQILNYPMLDDRSAITRPVPAHMGTFAWTRENNRFAWSAFLGTPAGSPNTPGGAVPSRVADLSGLPPTFIGVGALDLFLLEDMEYARRLLAAGVQTELVVVPGAFHGFDLIAPDTNAAAEFGRRWEGALARWLAP